MAKISEGAIRFVNAPFAAALAVSLIGASCRAESFSDPSNSNANAPYVLALARGSSLAVAAPSLVPLFANPRDAAGAPLYFRVTVPDDPHAASFGRIVEAQDGVADKRRKLERAARDGDLSAPYKLAISFFDPYDLLRDSSGRLVDASSSGASPADLREARSRFADLASRDPSAATALAIMLEAGLGGEQHLEKARALYAQADTDRANWYLGAMLEAGLGGPRDLAGARAAYQRGSQESIEARYALARMTRLGLGGPSDPAQARILLMGIVAHCHGDGGNDLAVMADRGEGGPRDIAMAAENYIRGVECHNQYFRDPVLLREPRNISLDVRIEIQRELARYHGYSGPIDGAVDNAQTQLTLCTLAEE